MSTVTSYRVWRIRIISVVFCALSSIFLEGAVGLLTSSVVLMCVLDSTLLLYIVFTRDPSQLPRASNPLGKLALLKVPLMMIHGPSTQWFDSVCLSVWLVAIFLYDILLMLFVTIMLKCLFIAV